MKNLRNKLLGFAAGVGLMSNVSAQDNPLDSTNVMYNDTTIFEFLGDTTVKTVYGDSIVSEKYDPKTNDILERTISRVDTAGKVLEKIRNTWEYRREEGRLSEYLDGKNAIRKEEVTKVLKDQVGKTYTYDDLGRLTKIKKNHIAWSKDGGEPEESSTYFYYPQEGGVILKWEEKKETALGGVLMIYIPMEGAWSLVNDKTAWGGLPLKK